MNGPDSLESMDLCSYCCSLVKGLKESSFKCLTCYTFLIWWRKLYAVVVFINLKTRESHKTYSLVFCALITTGFGGGSNF